MMSVFCSNKVTLGGLQDGSWARAAHQKERAMMKNLRFSALPPILLNRKD